MSCRWVLRSRGFTLLEVLGAVLVLGLFVTVLAGAAMQGLRSEGVDRRRAEASLLADEELGGVESGIATGIIPELGRVEQEADPYTVVIEVAPEDVLALLPREMTEELARESGQGRTKTASLLYDERGESRVRRVSVSVEWDEAGQPYSVARTTYTFDTSELVELFPTEEETAADKEIRDLEAELGELPPILRDELRPPKKSR